MSPDLLCRSSRAVMFLCSLLVFDSASALTVQCVSNATELQIALNNAATNNLPDVIGLEAKTYALTSPLSVNVTDGYALTIQGGYSTGCASLINSVPDNTIITGANNIGTRVSLSSSSGGITLRGFSITAMNPAAGANAILVKDDSVYDSIHIENLAVYGNTTAGPNDYILALLASGGLLFDDNIVHDNAAAKNAVYVTANLPALPITIANNTIANNTSNGLYVSVYSESQILLFNNILWNNGANDLTVPGVITPTPPLASNNTWKNCAQCGGLSIASINQSSVNPQLTPNYRLGSSSAAINSGLPLPTVLPALDAGGNFRVKDGAPDRGAYETTASDPPAAYTVTTTGDVGQGTLRDAITNANMAGGPAIISFNIGNSGCGPQIISLSTPLPSITVPMTINGYSQSGASLNTLPLPPGGEIKSNATLCVMLLGATSPTVTSAIVVDTSAPSYVHVDIRGILFENFTRAIDFSGGDGHWVHGNSFGGPFLFGTFQGNGIGIQIDGGIADVIGGPAAADVNLIGLSTGVAGVVITGGLNAGSNSAHTVVNNSIGGEPAGAGATYGNINHGIQIINSRQNSILSNWISANGGDGINIDNSAYNLVQKNTIGSTNSLLGNDGTGVHLLDGAFKNRIGSANPAGTSGVNEITANGGAGVWISPDAGIRNQVSGGGIYRNSGLAIDLAQAGPTLNSANENSGPNNSLHKPVLTKANLTISPQNFTVVGTIPTTANSTRVVTFYASQFCGDALQIMGSQSFTSSPAGVIDLNINLPIPIFSPAYITVLSSSVFVPADTSEISNCKKLSINDDIFYDGYDDF